MDERNVSSVSDTNQIGKLTADEVTATIAGLAAT